MREKWLQNIYDIFTTENNGKQTRHSFIITMDSMPNGFRRRQPPCFSITKKTDSKKRVHSDNDNEGRKTGKLAPFQPNKTNKERPRSFRHKEEASAKWGWREENGGLRSNKKLRRKKKKTMKQWQRPATDNAAKCYIYRKGKWMKEHERDQRNDHRNSQTMGRGQSPK